MLSLSVVSFSSTVLGCVVGSVVAAVGVARSGSLLAVLVEGLSVSVNKLQRNYS